jgi:hypothetical protein
MVRSELLRAKSLHAEVAYLRDLKRVGDAKRVADHHNQVFGEKERKFWSEAIKAKVAPPGPAAGQVPPAGGNQGFTEVAAQLTEVAAQLDRMRRAHSQLQQAQRSQQTANKTLHEGLMTLSASQKRVEVLEALLSKSQRIRANQVESRLSEDVADLVTTSRTVFRLRASRSADAQVDKPSSLEDGVFKLDTTSQPGNVTSQPSYTNQPLSPTIQNQITPPLQTSQTQIAQPIAALHQPSRANEVGISHVAFTREQGQTSLALSCAISGRGTVHLQVTKAGKGGLKVLIDPSVGAVASGVLRDKHSIQSRLQAMGIKISTIEVGVTSDTTGAPRRAKRSQCNGEEDESSIS